MAYVAYEMKAYTQYQYFKLRFLKSASLNTEWTVSTVI